MSKYAFGIAAHDDEVARQDLHARTRNQNISDILNGIGVLAQSVGSAHRMAQQNANQATTASMMAGMMQYPDGMPTAQGPTQAPTDQPGPAMMGQRPGLTDQSLIGSSPGAPMQQPAQPGSVPWASVIQRQMAQQARPASMMEKFGNMFNMSPQGRLDPQSAMALMQMQAQRQAAGLTTQKSQLEIEKLQQDIAGAPGQRNHIDSETLLNQAMAEKAARDPSAAPRNPEITSKDYATVSDRAERRQAYIDAIRTKNDPTASDADREAAGNRLMLVNDRESYYDVGTLQKLRQHDLALMEQLKPGSTKSPSTSTDMSPDEALVSDNGKDTEVMGLIQQFKTAHPGMPFDKAAFAGWIRSGR